MRLPPTLRRLLPLAFMLTLIFLVGRTCQSEAASAEIALRIGDAAAEVRQVRADLFRADERDGVGYFEAAFPQGSGQIVGPWKLSADAGSYRVQIEVRTVTGLHRIERAVEITDRARITIDLEREL